MRYKRSINIFHRRLPVTGPLRQPRIDSALLNHLLATVPIGCAFVDAKLRFLRVSKTLSDIDGLSPDDHIGRSIQDVIGADNWAMIQLHCKAALDGRSVCDAEMSGIFPHSRHCRQVRASFYPIHDNGAVTAIAIGIKDITDPSEKRTEETFTTSAIVEPHAMRRLFLTEALSTFTEGKLKLCPTADDLPDALTPVGPALPLSPEALSLFRHQVMDAADWLEFEEERKADFVLAVGEALDNALVHAKDGHAQVLVDQERGSLQVRVTDHGLGIDESHLHRAALERGYTTAGTLGQGFCLILNTCDRIWLKTGPNGTTIVLEQDRIAPVPAWLFAA